MDEQCTAESRTFSAKLCFGIDQSVSKGLLMNQLLAMCFRFGLRESGNPVNVVLSHVRAEGVLTLLGKRVRSECVPFRRVAELGQNHFHQSSQLCNR